MTEPDPPPEDELTPEELARIAQALPGVSPGRVRKKRMKTLLLERTRPKTRVVRDEEGDWLAFLPGVTIKVLRLDKLAGTQTSLWRLAAGARIPPHPHSAEEECLILEGSVMHEGVEYRAGDYLLAGDNVRHSGFESPDGALLMIRGETVSWPAHLYLRIAHMFT